MEEVFGKATHSPPYFSSWPLIHYSAFLNLVTEAGILSKLGQNKMRLRTSIYADDAAIFLRPIKEEVTALKHLLQLFGEVTGLRTNIHKSSVVPIRCENLDLDDILCDFPAQRTSSRLSTLDCR